MNTAYLDCFSGVSGDMLLGALLDTGVPESYLREVLAGLSLQDGYTLSVERRNVQNFAATQVRVDCPNHGHSHRHLTEIQHILENSAIDPAIRNRAFKVFVRLAEAEASVHGTSPEQVHFHEAGAVDAIVDIVGTIAGFAYLHIDTLTCSPLPMPRGWVTCQHGEIPLPGPAVCALLAGVPVYGENLEQELVTPTGAALVRELAGNFGPMPPMRLGRTGYGAGSSRRADGRPNLLRLMLGQNTEVEEAQVVEVIETHLDDWNPEFWPHVNQRLMDAHALDVCLIPLLMKKGRPGFLLRVVVEPAHRPEITTLLFDETSSIGLRIRREQRMTLPRKIVMVATPWGPVAAKKITTPSGTMITPEYEPCRVIAETHRISLQSVYAAIRCHSSADSD